MTSARGTTVALTGLLTFAVAGTLAGVTLFRGLAIALTFVLFDDHGALLLVNVAQSFLGV
jgi:hypothetical protein